MTAWSDYEIDQILDGRGGDSGTVTELNPNTASVTEAQAVCDAIRARAAQRAIPIFAWVQEDPDAPKIIIQHEPMGSG